MTKAYIFRTPDLLKRPFFKLGKPCHDSLIKVWANGIEEARMRFNKAVAIGKEIGFYK